jgi:hypothetical protein
LHEISRVWLKGQCAALQLMRSDTRPHGSSAKPDPLLADLGNAENESLAAHLASLR